MQIVRRIPYLYEPAFQWYPSFTLLGELIEPSSPLLNPTPAIDLLVRVLSHLTTECKWPPERVHLFGFGQGGSVGVECILRWWRDHRSSNQTEGTEAKLGSVVTVDGPLLSFPTLSAEARCLTPVLFAHRSSSATGDAPSIFKKGFGSVVDVSLGSGEGMPRSRDEWEPIMRFWSERLGRRLDIGGEGVYEVVS